MSHSLIFCCLFVVSQLIKYTNPLFRGNVPFLQDTFLGSVSEPERVFIEISDSVGNSSSNQTLFGYLQTPHPQVPLQLKASC